MEKEDHLDKETSVTMALTETGVELKARSRTAAIIDRMTGNFFERFGTKGERRTQINRRKTELESSLVEKAGAVLLKRVETDEEFALSVLDATFKKDARRQLNKEGVVVSALEYLQNEPPSDAESNSGPEVLSDEFTDRFERYAEDASTDVLRERWGRVLAGEIRKPGTFNRKVLRAVDEIDGSTAMLFESLAGSSGPTAIYKMLISELSYQNRMDLFSFEVTLDSSDSNIQYCGEFEYLNVSYWNLYVDGYIIAIPKNIDINYSNSRILLFHNNKLAIPCHHLSDVGTAIRSILMVDTAALMSKLAKKLEEAVGENVMLFFQEDKITGGFKRILSFN